MRQRVIIAMALALDPELVIMDEPTTALDVVVQREILQQIHELQRELGFAVLFITHDLSLLLEFADRIAIMYAGEIVEEAPAGALRTDPRHPYTVGPARLVPAAARRRSSGWPASPARRPTSARRPGLPLPSALPALRARGRRRSTRGRRRAAACCAQVGPETIASPATSSSAQ